MDDILQLRDPLLRHVLDAWRAAAGEAALPDRRALDPVALGRALPHVWLCEREPASGRFRYRLAGERINEIYRRSLAGLYLDEIIPAPGIDIVKRRYRAVVETPAAMRTSGLVYPRNDRTFSGERLILPLTGTSGSTDTLLGVTVYGLPGAADAPVLEQETAVARLRPSAGDRGWIENKAGERVRTLE